MSKASAKARIVAAIALSILSQAPPRAAADAACSCQNSADALIAADPSSFPYPYQGSAQSTALQGGTESTTLQGGASGAMIRGQVDEQGGPVNVLILIDSSYSMKDKLGEGEPKMISAKRVLESTLARIPPDVNIGLRVFGQGYSGSPEIDCQQSSLLVAIGNGNRRSIIEQVRQLRPFGLTPLTYALMQAERDLRRATGQKTIILISDGAETCGGDPCEYISRLHRLGVNIKVDIVGLGLRRERDARNQLNCIAEHSGGKYYDANSAAELADSISHMVNAALSGRVIPKVSRPAAGTAAETPPASGGADNSIPMQVPVVPGK